MSGDVNDFFGTTHVHYSLKFLFDISQGWRRPATDVFVHSELMYTRVIYSWYTHMLQPQADHQGWKTLFLDFLWIGLFLVEKVISNKNYILRKLNTNRAQTLDRTRLRKYNSQKPPENHYQEVQCQVLDNVFIPQHELYTYACESQIGGLAFAIPIIYTDLLTSMHVNLMKVPHCDQTLLFSRALIFMIQAMVKTGILASPLTHLRYILLILNRMVKVKILRPQQNYKILIVQEKHLGQTRTLKLHMELCNINHRSIVNPFVD